MAKQTPAVEPVNASGSDKTPAVEELQTQLNDLASANQKMKAVIDNPTIQKVISKLAKGEKVDLDPAPAAPSADTGETSLVGSLIQKKKPEQLDLNTLSNTELVEVFAEAVESHLGKTKSETQSAFTDEFSRMGQELKSTQEALHRVIATQSVNDLKTQHPDFDKYRDKISAVMQKYPQLDVSDAYRLAKAEHMQNVPPVQQLESERPESSVAIPEWRPDGGHRQADESDERKPQMRGASGSRGFRDSLGKVLEKKLANR